MRRRGFSLTELLVVVGIVLLLTALSLRFVGAGRQAGREKEAERFGTAVLLALEQAAAEGVFPSKGSLLAALPTGTTQSRTGTTVTLSANERLCERIPRLTGSRTRFPQAPPYIGCVVSLQVVSSSAGDYQASVARFRVRTWVKGNGAREYVQER